MLARQYYQTADSLALQAQYQKANSLIAKGQHIYHSQNLWEKYIEGFNLIAHNLWMMSAYDSSKLTIQQAEMLSAQYLTTHHPVVASTYTVLGMLEETEGNYENALSYYQQGLAIRHIHYPADHIQMVESYLSLGIIHQQLGSYDSALLYYKKTLSIREAAQSDDYEGLANTYTYVGMIYYHKGDHDQALDYLGQALNIRKKLPNKFSPGMASSYICMGVVYKTKRAYELALRHYKQAMLIVREVFGDTSYAAAVNYGNIGMVYQEIKDFDKALLYHNKSLDAKIELYGEEHDITATSYASLGGLHLNKGEYEQSLQYHQKALNIKLKLLGEIHHSVALSYSFIGEVYKRMKMYTEAESYYQKALSINDSLFGFVYPENAAVLRKIGDLYCSQKRYSTALKHYQQSILANGGRFRDSSAYSNPVLDHYLHDYHLFVTLKNKASALSLLHYDSLAHDTYLLADSLVNQLRGQQTDFKDKMIASHMSKQLYENAIQNSLSCYEIADDVAFLNDSFYYSERSRAVVLTESSNSYNAKRFGQVPDSLLALESFLRVEKATYRSQLGLSDSSTYKNKLFYTNQRYDSLIGVLETQYPDYYRLKYATRTATISDIRKRLASDEAVVSYFIGDSTYYAFAITPEHFRVVPLPVDTLLSERITSLRQMLSTDSVATGGYRQNAYALYQQLLAPVVADSALAAVKKLTIIPDGVLGYLPFELLLTQPATAAGEYADLPYLLRDYTVRYGYSATWLFHPFSRPETSAIDQYVAFAPHYPATVSDSVQQLAFGRFRNQVAPLRWNQQEVSNIDEYLSGVNYTQGAAVERRFKEEVSQYRVVHLAMHALIDDRNPMYSRLVFSQDTADTQEDGSLNAYELYNMEIPAELVVLSACETGYGKLERGEGIMSLARAFAYAGCPSIVMSHWLVDDKSSAQLMDHFYRYLSKGLSKDESLRQAKLAYLETASVQKAHPFFWANFVLVGDASPLTLVTVFSTRILYATGTLLLLLGLAAIAYRHRHRLGIK
ncbi:MAG: CHAT domain-containing tetratricopeptide repeat protein [Tunicatimonas sp.]